MGQDVSGLAVMDHGRRHQAETRVVMLMVGHAPLPSVVSASQVNLRNGPEYGGKFRVSLIRLTQGQSRESADSARVTRVALELASVPAYSP